MKDNYGFTILEFLLVIAVIGILAAIVLPRLSNFNDKAKDTAISSVASSIRTGMEAYHQDKNNYPDQTNINDDWDNLDQYLDVVELEDAIDYNINSFTYITTNGGYRINVVSYSTGKEYIITQDDFTEGTAD